jgi:hypothetical protein
MVKISRLVTKVVIQKKIVIAGNARKIMLLMAERKQKDDHFAAMRHKNPFPIVNESPYYPAVNTSRRPRNGTYAIFECRVGRCGFSLRSGDAFHLTCRTAAGP